MGSDSQSHRFQRSRMLALLALVVALLAALSSFRPSNDTAFIAPASPSLHAVQAPVRYRIATRAAEVVDAEMADDEEEEEEFDDEEEVVMEDDDLPQSPEEEIYGWPSDDIPEEEAEKLKTKLSPLVGLWKVGKKKLVPYPADAIEEAPYDEVAPDSWYERRWISRKKVEGYLFNLYKAPVEKFPHDLKPGDTVRTYFLDPTVTDDGIDWGKTKEVYFDGVILDFRRPGHERVMWVRSMVGKGDSAVGYEMQFPIHSPMVTKIEVLRRGYIGRNKNAFFTRALIGRKNQIPIDRERTERDKLYESLIEQGRADEIPPSTYPQAENERLPYTDDQQQSDWWDESKYDPKNIDIRSQFERMVLGGWRKRLRPGKKYTLPR